MASKKFIGINLKLTAFESVILIGSLRTLIDELDKNDAEDMIIVTVLENIINQMESNLKLQKNNG